jgi:hypothetical protein
MFYIVNKHCTKIIMPMFYAYFLSSKNNKYKQIKALELNLNIFLQNRLAIYFSYKVHHTRRLTKLEPYFSEPYMIYYAFSKKTTITRIK